MRFRSDLIQRRQLTYYNLAATHLERGNQRAALEQYNILKPISAPLAEELYLLIYQPMATVASSETVKLNVFVTDAQGVPVSNLNQADFLVLEDGVPQTISSFSRAPSPLIYSLTIDNSGSVRPVINLIVGTAGAIVKNNLPGDETVLIRLVSSEKMETVQEFTSNQPALQAGLDTLFIDQGPSAILDAVYLSAQKVAHYKFAGGPIRRAVVLLSDGVDRDSYYSIKDVLTLLRKLDVQVFAISLGSSDKKGAKLNQDQPQGAIDLLTTLTTETGGRAYFPKSVDELETSVKQMFALIRNQYDIRYKSADSHRVETYRRVDLRLAPGPGREKWTLVTRPGYLVPQK